MIMPSLGAGSACLFIISSGMVCQMTLTRAGALQPSARDCSGIVLPVFPCHGGVVVCSVIAVVAYYPLSPELVVAY